MANGDSQTYTLNKDGTLSIKDEAGTEVRYAKESDLLAVKGGSDAAEKRLKEAEAGHKTAVDAINLQLNEANDKLNRAEAARQQLEEQLKQSAGSAEELAGVKQKLAEAEQNAEALKTKVLESRRQLIVTTFRVPPETVKDKTTEQLDAYEEALKAVTAGKGVGPYAIPAGGGAPSLTGKSPLELATMAYEQSKK